MKKEKARLTKKITLNKERITALNERQQVKVHGGGQTTPLSGCVSLCRFCVIE